MNIIKNVPKHNVFPSGKLWTFFADSKIGKSTFGAQWDKALIFDFENSTDEIECTVVKPKNLIEFRKDLISPQLKEFNTIVIDTFDVLYSMLADEVIDRMNRQNKTNYQSIGEFGFGTGWSNAKIETNKLIVKYFYPLMAQGKNIVLLLHEKSEIISREGKPDRTIYSIALPGQTATLVNGLSYTIGRIYIENETRFISFSPGIDKSGTRSRALAGKKIPVSYKMIVETIEKYKSAAF
jgi:hypothetical protein